MYDVVTIGSATMDAFIENDKISVVSVNTVEKHTELMALPYGAKLEIEGFSRQIGGGGINTAANFANLGLKTSTIIKLGDDDIKPTILSHLEKHGVNTNNVVIDKTNHSGFSMILVSFQGDRTVLAYRGANEHINEKDINFDAIKESKWLYVAPLAGESNRVLDKIAQFAEANGTNLAMNAGTTAIKRGEKYFSKILQTAEILMLNKEEASMLTKIEVRPDTKHEKFSQNEIHPDLKAMLERLRGEFPVLTVVTDGKNGVWAYDGNKFYNCPSYPAKVRSTLGAGDAFASTFMASIERTNWDVEKSLKIASVNSANVCEFFGAQEGFLTFEQIEERLVSTPDYGVRIIGA